MSHDLDDDDAMVAVGGTVEAVDGVGGDAERGIEAEGGVGHADVIVYRLWQRDDVEPLLRQLQRVLLRAAATKADQHVEVVAMVVLDDQIGHVLCLAGDLHLVRLVPAGAENRAADGENAGQHAAAEIDAAVLHQSAKAVAKADDPHAEGFLRGLADAANGGIESGAVAAGGEDSDALGHGPVLRLVEA